MNKIKSGELFIYQDEISNELQQRIIPTKQVATLGTVGEYNQEALIALLQVAPALYGKVFGLTRSGLQIVANKFEMGGTTVFAKAIMTDNNLFQDLISALVQRGLVRQEEWGKEIIYFPTETYLKSCSLIG